MSDSDDEDPVWMSEQEEDAAQARKLLRDATNAAVKLCGSIAVSGMLQDLALDEGRKAMRSTSVGKRLVAMLQRRETKTRRRFHDPSLCEGQFCVIHNPSNHPMKDWPKIVRETGLIERRCSCGVGHPDPDSVAFFERIGVTGFEIHGCCGCCTKGKQP